MTSITFSEFFWNIGPTVLPLLHPSNGNIISSYFITSKQMILCPCHLHASTNMSFTNQLLMQMITAHCTVCASQPETHHWHRTCSSYIWNYLALYCNVHTFFKHILLSLWINFVSMGCITHAQPHRWLLVFQMNILYPTSTLKMEAVHSGMHLPWRLEHTHSQL
jgi:hypothetical protein